MNPFESGARKLIPAVLIYVKRGDSVLMIHRVGKDGSARAGDFHSGKWNGLGGKFEAGESPWAAARRELMEESGLSISERDFRCLGVLQFPDFKPAKSEDWLCYVFVAALNPSEPAPLLHETSEGSLHWVPSGELLDLNIWSGDRHFIPLVLREEPFLGTIWYENGEAVRHELRPISRR